MIKALFLLSLSATTIMTEAKPLKIYFGETTKAPYDNHAGAMVLSTFNAAVRGQLVETDETFRLKPGLLQEFRYDYTEKKYVLKLAPNLKFHNGRNVNCLDLEFSLLRGFFSSDKSFFYTYLNGISGIDKIASKKFEHGLVKGVTCVDEQTLHVKLSTANPSFLHTLAVPYFSLVPKEELQDDYLTWKKAPIGVGPYRVIQPFDGEKTVIELVDKDQMGPKKVWFLANIKNEKADIALDKSAVKSNSVSSFSPLYPGNIRVLEFSRVNPLSSNPNFRKAVDLLIDREGLKNEDLGISPTDQLLPKHFWGRTKSSETKAKEAKNYISKIPKSVLKKRHHAIVFSGPTFSEKNEFYIRKLEDAFKNAGLDIKFGANNEKFISEETAKESPISMFGMVCDYIDPLIMFSAYREGSHANHYLPDEDLNKEFESHYSAASKNSDFSSRLEAVRGLSQFTKENSIVVPIAEEKSIFYFDSSVIEGLGNQVHPITLLIENLRLKQ
jgi:oligopeptide transport system substrate-binding protein